MAYIFETDPRYAPRVEVVGDAEQVVQGQTAPHDRFWAALAQQNGIPVTVISGEGDASEYVTNPEFTAFKGRMKAQGYDVGMEDIPGIKYQKNFTLLKNGAPVSEPQRVKTGQSFLEAAADLAPIILPAFTAGFGADLAQALGVSRPVANALISGGFTAATGGDISDIATSALTSAAGSYASQALTGGGMSSGLTPEMQATISNNPQGAFLGESAIPSPVAPQPTITGYDLGAAAPLAGSAGDMMTGIDMSGNVVNSLTGEVLVPATTAPINALAPPATQPATPPTVAEATTTPPTVAEAATTPPADTTAGLSSADRAALYGNAGYGEGMTGAQTGAFDTTLGLTGSTALAAGAATVAGAAGTAGSLLGEALDFVTSPAGAATIGAVGSVAGGVMAADAATEAAQLQSEAARNELALLTRMYEEGVARQAPFLQGGTQAFNRLVGLQTGGPEAAQQFLQMDPGYGFRLGEGMKALERVQAARGGLLSGGAIKAGQRYAQDVASQEYGNAYNRLAGLANLGPQAAGVMSNLGQQYATSAGGAMQDAAAYQGAGTLGRTSAYMGAMQGGLNALSGYANQQQQNQLINRLLGGG